MSHSSAARIFVTGIGTGVGKTIVSAIITEALAADYWKPVQAGYDDGTDSEWVQNVISNKTSTIHPERYRLKLPASPHIAARQENMQLTVRSLVNALPETTNHLVIEGAGGLMVPLNNDEFVADLAFNLNARVVLVSRNQLGSINHSLLTAMVCKQKGINIAGWIFNGNYLDYEEEIVRWTGIPRIMSIPDSDTPGKVFVKEQAEIHREQLKRFLC